MTIVVVYLLLLGLRLVLTGRSPVTRLAGGVVLAAAVTIKIIPILPVAFLLFIQLTGFLRQRWRRQPRAAEIGWRFVPALSGVGLGLVLFFLLLPAALIGWNQNLRHLGTWQRLVLSSAGAAPRRRASRRIRIRCAISASAMLSTGWGTSRRTWWPAVRKTPWSTTITLRRG